MKLIIVESPTKARTLSRFISSDYQIEATMGHLRDLPKSKMGVEIESKKDVFNFIPTYELMAKKKETIDKLKAEAAKADQIILATDPDREGEAIAWHVGQILSNKSSSGSTSKTGKKNSFSTSSTSPTFSTFNRIVFHEITESAIKEALGNPREIDMNLVNAQQARRILDRLVGYKLSPLLWRKIRRGLSAGRVQSVTVRLVVEREKEIKQFKPEEYWRIFADLTKNNQIVNFELVKLNGEKIEEQQTFKLFDGEYTVTRTKIKTQAEAQQIIDQLKDQTFKVTNVATSGFTRTPPPAFTTSSLQQEANRRFGFTSKRTMNIAQKLYEEGKITYHRTDSVVLSNQFMGQTQQYIIKNYGQDYSLQYFRKYTTKQKLAQEAHEAIRPTSIGDRGEGLMASDESKLYELIWKRALATQMKEASLEKTAVTVSAGKAELLVEGVKIVFNGYLVLYKENSDDKILPPFTIGDFLTLKSFIPTQKFSEPPPRYTEATLIKALEEKGIGRPSTYAPIISTIQQRQYIEMVERKFQPTILGTTVNDFLVNSFQEIVDIDFTAKMEDELDQIASGEIKWIPVLSDFYGPFDKKLTEVLKEAKRVAVPVEQTDEKCDKCGAPMVIRIGRFGRFLACSKFPDCKNTKTIVNKTGLKCPKCGGEIVIKKTKRRRNFFGCSNYPKCDFAAWRKSDIMVNNGTAK